MGMKLTWWESQESKPRMRGTTKYSAKRAMMMLGIAAMRSISAIRPRRYRGGAYSEMNRAVASPTGTAMMSAMSAISIPRGRIAAMPNWLVLMNQVDVVKNPKPTARKALSERRIRKTRISPVMASTAAPDARMATRKIRSPEDTEATMARGRSSLGADGGS